MYPPNELGGITAPSRSPGTSKPGERSPRGAKMNRVRPALLGLLAFASLALGKPPFLFAQAVREAQGEVVYVGGYLRDRALAQAMLQALNRGVTVHLYTSSYTYLDDLSYYLGLYLAGARLYLGLVPRYYLFVDGEPVAWGARWDDLAELPPQEVSRAKADLDKVRRTALPFNFSPETIVRGLTGGQKRR